MMIKICDELLCTGCGACSNICPMQCIQMNGNNNGFLYPNINNSECINCNKCVGTCPAKINVRDSFKNIKAYAAKYCDENIRMNSSSGGIFTALSTYIIKSGGVIFGAAFDVDFSVRHICVDNLDDLYKLRGSKYVQSTIGETYKQAKEYLDNGVFVLYTGTPCQIAGLQSFLGKNYDNLYTQDLICHGVPSPMVWKKYIEYREAKAASKTRRTFFRHKKNGWKMYSVQFIFENCTEYIQILSEDLYMRSFLRDITLRKSCYNCQFKTKFRSSDITLADFWGIDKVCPQMDDDKGTSLCIINSEKGQTLFNNIKDDIIYQEVNFEEAIKYNSAMTKSVPTNPMRNEFLTCVHDMGFEKAAYRYLRTPFTKRIMLAMKKILRVLMKINYRNK